MRLSPIPASGALSIPLAAADRLLWQARLGSMAILHLLGVELSLEDEHMVRLT